MKGAARPIVRAPTHLIPRHHFPLFPFLEPPSLLPQAHYHRHKIETQSISSAQGGERGCREHRDWGAPESCSLAYLGEGEGTGQVLQLPGALLGE